MKLGYTIVYVKSVPDPLSFYQSAFGLKTRFCLPSNEYGEIELAGDKTLAFANEEFAEKWMGSVFRRNRSEDGLSAGAEIGLEVDEKDGETVSACVERARAAEATVVTEPLKKPWGQTVACVKDCNGFLVEIRTPVQQ